MHFQSFWIIWYETPTQYHFQVSYRLIFGVQVNTGFANKLAECYLVMGTLQQFYVIATCSLANLGLGWKMSINKSVKISHMRAIIMFSVIREEVKWGCPFSKHHVRSRKSTFQNQGWIWSWTRYEWHVCIDVVFVPLTLLSQSSSIWQQLFRNNSAHR